MGGRVRVAGSQLALIEDDVLIGARTLVWAFAQVRAGARIGEECNIGSHSFIDAGVRIGNRCKVLNGAMLFAPAVLGDGVFIGPGAILTNDRYPRATNKDGTLKLPGEWQRQGIVVETGASIGAGAIILPGVTIGASAMVGAGSIVTRDVPAYSIWRGESARPTGRFHG